MSFELKTGYVTQDRRLDRVVGHEESNLDWLVRTVMPFSARSYRWNFNKFHKWLDQKSEGACVGFGWGHEIMCRPWEVDVTDQFCRELYWDAQRNDPWPGGAYPGAVPFMEGTSVNAGALAARKRVNAKGRPLIEEWRWCLGANDVLTALSKGPVVMGTVWTPGMFDTNEDGFVDVSGPEVGGHCWTARGAKVVWNKNATHDDPKFIDRHATPLLSRNSWGPDWGKEGDFLITLADLDSLLARDGEACAPILRNK